MTKTDQTFAVLRDKAKAIGYGEWPIRIVVFSGEIVGFDEIDRAVIKYRAGKEKIEENDE